MATLCLNASLEMLQPLCCRSMHRLQGDLCRYFYKGSLPLLSQGISSDCPGCCDSFGKPCPPKQPTIYSPGG